MTRSSWASSSKQVLVSFGEDGPIHLPSSDQTGIVQPNKLFETLVSPPYPAEVNGSSSNNKVAYVAIQIPRHIAYGSQKKRSYLIVSIGASESQPDTLNEEREPSVTLPSSFRRYFDRRRLAEVSDLKLSIRPCSPIKLSHVILAAKTGEAFAYARQAQQAIEAELQKKLLRQDDVINLAGNDFRILMTEPALQGIAVAGSTHFLVTLDQSTAKESEEMQEDGVEEQIDPDFSIDERFLANTVLDDFDSENEEEDDDKESTRRLESIFEAIPIQDRSLFDEVLSLSRQRLALGKAEVDEEAVVLLDESGLAALGAFEGDWAIADVPGGTSSRVVKLFSGSLPSPSSPRLQAHISPLLLQNLLHEDIFVASEKRKPIRLQVLRSGKSVAKTSGSGTVLDCPLPLPFADSLTISRIAGPLSINRRFQSLFLSALRAHFEGRKRVIRLGDVLAVAFDKGKVRWIRGAEAGGEEETEGDANVDIDDYDLPWSEGDAYTAIVYFSVTSLTPELSEPDQETGESGLEESALREQARLGELGCVVDAGLTKMVQTGVCRMRVADALGWLQIQSDTPPLPTDRTLCGPGSVFDKLLRLVNATLLPDASDYGLHLTVLLKGARGSGKKTVLRWLAQHTGVHLIELNCFDLIADTDARTEGVLRARFEQAASCAPAILLLQNIDALARKSQAMETGREPMMATVLQDCIEQLRESATTSNPPLPISVFGTTSSVDKCPTGVLGCFKHEISIEAPSEAERLSMLQLCLQDVTLSVDVDVKNLATQTAALVASDLVDLVSRAQAACVERISQLEGVRDDQVIAAGTALTGKDFEIALAKARLNYSETIGAPKIPNVTWDDVGGLASVKDDILDTIQLPLEHPELFTDGLKKRSGILLYGPPGTGKTLLAKAVATSCSLNFFSVKGPELLNMYIGESEANVRRVFQRARDAKPCVIFFDELDSIAPKRGNQGDSGGVMDRIVSQLLAELDGMSSSDGGGGEVFVIGATNRPDLLDPALLRPGRFDRMLYLSVSETHADQLNILQALTRKFTLDEDVGDLSVIAEQCPFNLTGADFYALCSDAMLKSMTRKAASIDEEIKLLNARSEDERRGEKHPYPLTTQYYLDEMTEPASLAIRVGRQDFEAALQELVPSVSMQEMQHYREVQAKFSSPSDSDQQEQQAEQTSNGLTPAMSNGHATMQQLQDMLQKQMIDAGSAVQAEHDNGHDGKANGTSHTSEGGDEMQRRRKSKGKGKAKE